jgi:TolA-binding protein
MKTQPVTLKSPKSSLFVKGILSGALAIVCSSNVQAFTVIDPTQIYQNGLNSVKEVTEAANQLKEAQKQLEEAKKHLAKLQGLTNTQMEITDKLEERDINYQMDLYCPGAGNGLFASLKGALTINPGGNIKEEQKKVCQNMVMAKNAQYNEAVKVLKLVKERNKELKAIEDRRQAAINAGGEPGALAAINLDFQQLASRTNLDTQYSNTVIGAYGAYYSALESTQTQLGKSGMSGDTGNKTFASELVGKFVQGAALEAGLQVARTRER